MGRFGQLERKEHNFDFIYDKFNRNYILINKMWTKYYIARILCKYEEYFSYILYWPGEEAILIPP